MKRWLHRLITTLVALLFFAGVFLYAIFLFAPVRSSSTPVRVEIPLGSNVKGIARRLQDAGLIRSGLAFQFMARILGESKNMKAGEYRIPPNLGVIQIIDKLVAGDAEAQWVVIPEGKTALQIAAILNSQRLARVPEFLRAVRRRPGTYGLDVPSSWRTVDGYLMPDSYKFAKRSSERKLVRAMLKNWNEKVYRPDRALFAGSDLPVDKIIVIASMIEREAKAPGDREQIASVIRNRLARGMLLQVDATVQFALPRHKAVLSYADLKTDSPYNTYLHHGLPPGPICNPGAASILAALKPAKTQYLYYVARPDGSHIFSRTGAEHAAAILKVKKEREQGVLVGAARSQ